MDLVQSSDVQSLSSAAADQIHYNVLIELTDTSSKTQQQISTVIQPFIECAAANGSYLSVTFDRGEQTELYTPDGMDGVQPIAIQFENERREVDEKRAYVADTLDKLGQAIADSSLGSHGSASRLLNYAASLNTESGSDTKEVFVIWSPLLGTSSDGADCLDVSGVAPTDQNAKAIIARCTGEGLILPVTGAGVTLVGTAAGAHDTEQQRFAAQLRDYIYQGIFNVNSGGNG